MDRFLRKPLQLGDKQIIYFGFIENNHCWRKGYSTPTEGGELIPENAEQARTWFLEMLVQEAMGNIGHESAPIRNIYCPT
jgi:hypothetical protein